MTDPHPTTPMTEALSDLRQGIDSIDDQILALLAQRGRLVQKVGELKQESDRPFFVPAREVAIMERLKGMDRGPFPWESVERVFREIISASIALERPLEVAFLGPATTFTHQAALKQFGGSVQYRPVRTIPEVFREVETACADYGVVPVENAFEGMVIHTLDSFSRSPLKIVAEINLPIAQYLLGKGDLAGVKKIYSHYQPFLQCNSWLNNTLPEIQRIEVASTTEAAARAAQEEGAAAIAPLQSAEVYGLDVLAEHIEDHPDNTTRFLVIGRHTTPPAGGGRDKTSLLLSAPDRPGALFDMLAPFNNRGLNLTRIESRPTRQQMWQYHFFVDLIGHQGEATVRAALAELETMGVMIKVLGSYPMALRGEGGEG